MDIEFWIWGIVPIVFLLAVSIVSVSIAWSTKRLIQIIIAGISLLVNAVATYMLVLITFFEAWPTYTPHLLAVLTLIALLGQLQLNRAKT